MGLFRYVTISPLYSHPFHCACMEDVRAAGRLQLPRPRGPPRTDLGVRPVAVAAGGARWRRGQRRPGPGGLPALGARRLPLPLHRRRLHPRPRHWLPGEMNTTNSVVDVSNLTATIGNPPSVTGRDRQVGRRRGAERGGPRQRFGFRRVGGWVEEGESVWEITGQLNSF